MHGLLKDFGGMKKKSADVIWHGFDAIVLKNNLYNNVTSVGIFIGCWLWSIKLKDTHRDGVKSTSGSRQRTWFSFFMPQKSFNKPFEFLLYKTNRLHFFLCVL